tara:strand:- start:118 stop:303 length:186 start_codon:yes stop_codon:yes gene_type:complete
MYLAARADPQKANKDPPPRVETIGRDDEDREHSESDESFPHLNHIHGGDAENEVEPNVRKD